jgi:hypothetical protein
MNGKYPSHEKVKERANNILGTVTPFAVIIFFMTIAWVPWAIFSHNAEGTVIEQKYGHNEELGEYSYLNVQVHNGEDTVKQVKLGDMDKRYSAGEKVDLFIDVNDKAEINANQLIINRIITLVLTATSIPLALFIVFCLVLRSEKGYLALRDKWPVKKLLTF